MQNTNDLRLLMAAGRSAELEMNRIIVSMETFTNSVNELIKPDMIAKAALEKRLRIVQALYAVVPADDAPKYLLEIYALGCQCQEIQGVLDQARAIYERHQEEGLRLLRVLGDDLRKIHVQLAAMLDV